MPDIKRLSLRYIEGPSLQVPYPSVVTEFSSPFNAVLSPNKLKSYLIDRLPPEFGERFRCPPGDITFMSLTALLADALQDTCGLSQFPAAVQQRENGEEQIILSCFEPRTSVLALRAGVQIAQEVFKLALAGASESVSITDLLQQADRLVKMSQPDVIACALIRAARKRGIPVDSVSPGSRIWVFGQGSAGHQFFEAANQNDSLTGHTLTRDKFLSNQLIIRLGFPGVRHGVAKDVTTAKRIARELGFPVVVKPPDMGKGRGVRTGIRTEQELTDAVSGALAISAKGALVEKEVPGDDHRLTVVGGKFAWAARRSPPRIIGDGLHTIVDLVEAENLSRSDADVAAGFTTRLTIDTDMRAVLAKQGYTPEDKPVNGVVIQLRSIANIATGGTITDCSEDIHPDNREMAESIARGFRMDTLGIDFITADISRSWREGCCAVIEVNATPGFSSDARAEAILQSTFPNGMSGRIPSVVLIGGQSLLFEHIATAFKVTNKRVGEVKRDATLLNHQPRSHPSATLPEKIRALLLDSACDAIVIAATVADIERHGFPIDRCDLTVIAATTPVSDPLRHLCERCSVAVVDGVTEQNIDETLVSLFTGLFGDATESLSQNHMGNRQKSK